MISGEALAVALAVALTWWIGIATWDGLKWIGHQAKRGGTAIVHVIEWPFHHRTAPPAAADDGK